MNFSKDTKKEPYITKSNQAWSETATVGNEIESWTKSLSKNVSIQGLSIALNERAGYARRIIWGLLILAGLYFTGYNIIIQSIYFSGTPINVRFDIPRVKSLPFPVVTVCNFNSIALSTLVTVNEVQLLEQMKPLPFGENVSEMIFPKFMETLNSSFWTKFYNKYYTQGFDEFLIKVRTLQLKIWLRFRICVSVDTSQLQ